MGVGVVGAVGVGAVGVLSSGGVVSAGGVVFKDWLARDLLPLDILTEIRLLSGKDLL